MIRNNMKKQKGQVLLFVIVSMTIAMAVGIAAATRTLASLSRTALSDSSNKALAAAESGAEHFLAMDFEELATHVDADPTMVPFVDEVSGIATQAEVTVTSFTANSVSGSSYDFNLGTSYVKEIAFKDSGFNGNIKICWDNTNSALLYLVYGANGIISKSLVNPSNNSSLDTSNATTASSSGTYAGGCKTLTISPSAYGVRLHILYEDSNVYVSSTSGDLPTQGYKIISVGSLLEEGKVVTTKKVTVFKSKPYLPSLFDTAIYTEEDFN